MVVISTHRCLRSVFLLPYCLLPSSFPSFLLPPSHLPSFLFPSFHVRSLSSGWARLGVDLLIDFESERQKHFLWFSEYFWHQIYHFFYNKLFSSSPWTLTGSPTVYLSSDSNCLESAQTPQLRAGFRRTALTSDADRKSQLPTYTSDQLVLSWGFPQLSPQVS